MCQDVDMKGDITIGAGMSLSSLVPDGLFDRVKVLLSIPRQLFLLQAVR